MKRLLCVILALLMLAPFVLPAQAAGGSEDPSVAVWVNGNWVAAKSLAGLSGDLWLEVPISASVLKDTGEGTGATNYVRITSNVANGTTKDTQLNMMGSACGWSNTYISHNWWVDSDWASLGTVNADLAIEGWNGTQWLRIHNDHDCVADTSLTLGNVGGSDYQGYARNIWTDNNTLKNYTNFRIRVHLNIGTSLTVASGDILNLFPAENYHDCTFCETCGGCQSAACTLGHVLCDCGGDPPVQPGDNPSVAIYVNGNWISAVSMKELTGDQWIEFPINADALKDSGETNGATNYVRIASNVANGTSAESQLNLLFSNCGWSNTYVSHNWWVDDDWAAVDNCNADIAIEGWNGTQWVRIHNDHDCVGDVQMQLGLTGAGKYSGFARNIWVDNNTLKNYTNFRIRAHCVVGTSLAENKGDISALFPEENYRDCTFCELCGGCLSNHCTLGHVLCTCGGDPPVLPGDNPSLAIYVNGTWISAVSVKELTGDQWIEFPINADALKDSGETNGATNYVRIASNVANGASADSQINLLFSNCGWSNTFFSGNWWVDDDWSAIESSNADIAIEGWNGTQWLRIHNDHECAGDYQMQIGLTNAGTYAGFARNIWVENDSLKNYTNFRIRAHCVVGTSLAENKGEISALFPEENYRDCVFCETCGGCRSKNCTLGHVLCTCGATCSHEHTVLKGAAEATCTQPGYTGDYVCTNCGETVTYGSIIPALGHDLIDHAAQAATCTEKGWNAYQTCSRCDYTTYEEISALGHDLVRDDPVAPTCTEPGLTAGEHCSRCDFKVAQETVPALGHDLVRDDPVAATCTATGLTAGEHCSRCDYKVAQEETPALGHDWNDGEVTTPATATKDGVKTFTCKRCGATRTETIPATGENKPCDGGKDCPSYKFKDVNAGDWYHKAVDFAVTMGLFNGMTETTFEPNTPMTRAMLVTVLWRYEGSPEEGKNTFTDVPDGQWYANAVAWAAENAIVGGVGNNKFDPNGNITREQLATILFRYAGNKGYDISAFGDFTGFPDKNKISSWAADAYSWAVGEKLITGNNINGVIYLDPQGKATRAQVATILMRFLTKET